MAFFMGVALRPRFTHSLFCLLRRKKSSDSAAIANANSSSPHHIRINRNITQMPRN